MERAKAAGCSAAVVVLNRIIPFEVASTLIEPIPDFRHGSNIPAFLTRAGGEDWSLELGVAFEL
jgi:hypothetical protein